MKMRKFKIQNLVLSFSGLLEENSAMMYRGSRYVYDKVKSYYRWSAGDFAEFFTYFNSFSLNKWTKYTHVNNVYLQLRCKGKFKIRLFGHYRVGSAIGKEMYDEIYYDLPEMTDIQLPVPKGANGEVLGFQFDVLRPPVEDDEEELTMEEIIAEKEGSIAALHAKSQKAASYKSLEDFSEETEEEDVEEDEEEEETLQDQYCLCIEDGGWYTDIDEDILNDVRISIATTTFNNEKYIRRNMDMLERKIFYSGEDVRDHIKMIVIDNGRTLDPEEYNSEYITVIPNENVGGAGGFTRGMLESLDREDFKATHVLLMDDDVTMMPESFVRLYSLLALVKPQYKDRFVSGAMLYYEHMNIQHEDVGFVHDDGSFGPNKEIMDMEVWSNVFKNEEDIKFHEASYAGWWYCCIPVQKIRPDHLPVPLFIRGDDVEFSLANNAEFLTMGGICIWHKGFANKFNANLELYMVHRNSFIIQAMSGIGKDVDFLERIDKYFVSNICRYAYSNCDLLLDAVDEFCQGPDFMNSPQGERIMKEHAAKNEKMQPYYFIYNEKVDFDSIYDGRSEYDCIEEEEVIRRGDKETKRKKIKNKNQSKLTNKQHAYYLKTYNGQTLSDRRFAKKMNRKTAIIAYDWYDDPAKQYMAKEILAVNPADETAILRKRDRQRFKELMKRRKRVFGYYKKNRHSIEQAYREAAGRLQSEGFWRDYLKMNK